MEEGRGFEELEKRMKNDEGKRKKKRILRTNRIKILDLDTPFAQLFFDRSFAQRVG